MPAPDQAKNMAAHDDAPQPRVRAFVIDGHPIAIRPIEPGLHVVATPIGQLADITLRALNTLAAADVILAEDTRVTRRLLQHYGIATPVRRFDAHAKSEDIAHAATDAASGRRIALVSDAGTPLLSDPGAEIVRATLTDGGKVIPVPGPSALLAALVATGAGAEGFTFAGFLPSRASERKRRLRALSAQQLPLVFYEAPHRVQETLDDMLAILGDRPAAFARELTKMHEEALRAPLSALKEHFERVPPRGEFVLIVDPAADDAATAGPSVEDRLMTAFATHSVKDAASMVAAEAGLPRREVYALALKLKPGSGRA